MTNIFVMFPTHNGKNILQKWEIPTCKKQLQDENITPVLSISIIARVLAPMPY